MAFPEGFKLPDGFSLDQPRTEKVNLPAGFSLDQPQKSSQKLDESFGDHPAKKAMDYFQSTGWTKEQSAGIVGNLFHESAGMTDPNIRKHGGGAEYGLAQWASADRKQALMNYAASKGEAQPSFQTQLEFVNEELNSSESRTGEALRKAKNPKDAAMVFSYGYERPGKPMIPQRIKYAMDLYREKIPRLEWGKFEYLKQPQVTVGGVPQEDQTIKFPYSDKELQKAREMSMPGAFATGVGEGLSEFGAGLVQSIAALTGQKDLETSVTEQRMAGRREFEPVALTRPAARVGKIAGQVAPTALIPQAGPESLIGRALMGLVTGAGLGATSFVAPGESRSQNTLLGAGMGAAGSAALAVPSEAVNLAKGVPDTTTRQLAKKWGIRTTLAEDLTGMSGRWDVIRERLPRFMGGTSGWRELQRGEAQEAVKRWFGKYIIDPTADSTAAMKVANDAHLEQLYDVVRANAPNVPKGPAPEVKSAAGSLKKNFPAVFDSIQDHRIKGILNDIYGDVRDKTVQSSILGPSGQPYTRQVTPEFDFNTMWKLRQGVGREIGSTTNDIAKGELKTLYGAICRDMETMLNRAGGSAFEDFRIANEAFKNYSLKFDAIREAYDKAAGTTSASEVFSPKKFSTALKKLANDPQYKKNVQWSPGEIEEMTGLANILQTVKRSAQHLENPPTGNRWGPFVTTGVVEGAAYKTGGLLAALKTGGLATGTGWISRFLTTTEPGKRLAMAARKAEFNSPAMNGIMNQLYKQVPKFAAEMSMVEMPTEQARPRWKELYND